ncbi:MAG: LD-carboxypeptidase [Spirulinaceae cyanobacterium]
MFNAQCLTRPPPLKPGDLLRVVSPCGALKELEAFNQGVEIWRSRGYRVEFGKYWNSRYGYLAGTDLQRRQSLREAWQEEQCQGILCARGGYGSTRLLEDWQWWQENNLTAPKWLVGFSDVTGLLWSLATVGVASIHGPVLTTLAQEPKWSRQRLFDAVEGRPLAPLSGEGWVGGKATGILLPANLAVATNILGTPLQPPLTGTILAFEDVGEAPYRLDRMLTQWRMMGAFQGVKAIALGRFSDCEGSKSGWTVAEMLRDRLTDLNIPMVANLPFGHDGANAALPVGQLVELDGEQGILQVSSP